jgi:polysaccharide export outer membrane protein
MWNSAANVYVNGFSVNNAGIVELPLIGKVSVVGQTTEEVKDKIQTEAKKFIKDVTVVVKLLNYRYTVIGEVNRPGTYTNYNNNLTIYQAISNAGDASIYGDKTQSMIIRETKEGKISIPIDLTKMDVLNSDVYYIRPNDIIYIKPIRNKAFKQNLPNIALIFSSISTIILVISFIGNN